MVARIVVVHALSDWWKDVIVPLGAALIGAGAALYGGWRGAKWAAEEQRRQALIIDADHRRTQTQDALRDFDDLLARLVQAADGYAKQWST
jgi:hypothetical protein